MPIQLDLSKPVPLHEICQNEGFLWSVYSPRVFQENPSNQPELQYTSGYYSISAGSKYVLPPRIFPCDTVETVLVLCDNEPSACEAGYSKSFWKHLKCQTKLSKQRIKTDRKLLLILNVLLG